MLNQFSRTQLLYGKEAMDKLQNSHVAIFGLGGVGGYVGEALVRSGIGSFDLIDDDKICLTNLNRQIIATFDTVGQYKTDVMKERMLKINPKVNIQTHQCFFLPENASDFSFEDYDYIIDAIFGKIDKETYSLVHSSEQMEINFEIEDENNTFQFSQKNSFSQNTQKGEAKDFNTRKAFEDKFIPNGVTKEFYQNIFGLD